MRAIALAALAVTLAAAPAFAQTSATDIGPNADRDLWCAAAFGMLAYSLQQTGDNPGAAEASGNMQTLFAGIATEMQGKGLKKADFDTLVGGYTAATMNPFTAAAYTQDQCNAAVTEAKAAAPAPALAPDAAPAAPAATPDAAPAADAEPTSVPDPNAEPATTTQ